MPEQVKTRVLFLSDTHARAPKAEAKTSYPYRWPLPQADIAIHTGDLTMNGKISEHEEAVDLLKKLPAELKIVIPGNHDLTLDKAYYAHYGERWGPRPKYTDEQLQQIRDMYTGLEARAANIVYLEEGIRTLRVQSNGSLLTVYASAYTPEFNGWAFAYPHAHDRFNSSSATNPMPSIEGASTRKVDIALTHGPPYGVLDQVKDGSRVGCSHLLNGVFRAKPLVHSFGHIHESWGAVRREWPMDLNKIESDASPYDAWDAKYTGAYIGDAASLADSIHCRSKDTAISVDQNKVAEEMGAFFDASYLVKGSETLFLNSSIMDLRYSPRQAPWIVDLMLDKEQGTTERRSGRNN